MKDKTIPFEAALMAWNMGHTLQVYGYGNVMKNRWTDVCNKRDWHTRSWGPFSQFNKPEYKWRIKPE